MAEIDSIFSKAAVLRLQFFKTFNFIAFFFETFCPQLLIKHSSNSNVYHLSTLFTLTSAVPAFPKLYFFLQVPGLRFEMKPLMATKANLKATTNLKNFDYIRTLTFKNLFSKWWIYGIYVQTDLSRSYFFKLCYFPCA